MIALLIALAAVGAPAPPRAASSAQPASSTRAQAEAFGRLYVPTDLTIASAKTMFAKTFAASFDGSAESVAAEARFPGLRDAALAAGMRTLEGGASREVPALQSQVADLVQTRLSARELAAVLRFYQQPAIRRLQAAAGTSMPVDAMVAKAKAQPVPSFSAGELVNYAARGAEAAATPADRAAVAAFMVTPEGRRFGVLMPDLVQLVTARTNEMIESLQPQIIAASQSAAREFVRSAGAK